MKISIRRGISGEKNLRQGVPMKGLLRVVDPDRVHPTVKRTKLCELRPGEDSIAVFSPVGAGLAFKRQDRKGWRVVVNGKAGQVHDLIYGMPRFDRAGTRVVYKAWNGSAWVLVHGARKGPPVDEIDLDSLVYGPDGTITAVRVRASRGWGIQVGDRLGGAWDEVGEPVFSRSGQVAYPARRGKSWLIAGGRRRERAYRSITSLLFSDSSDRPIFIGGRGGRMRVVFEGGEGPPSDEIRYLQMSPDGLPVYEQRLGARRYLRVGDLRFGPYEEVRPPFLFPSGSCDPVFVVRSGMGVQVVWRGVPGAIAEEVRTLRWMPGMGVPVYGALRGGRWWIVFGEREGASFDEMGPFQFDPAGGRPAFAARIGRRRFVVRDGVAGRGFDDVGNPVFSSDGRHLAYAARRGRGFFIVRDEISGPRFDRVGDPFFAPKDGGLWYFAVRGGREFLVRDGVIVAEADRIVGPWRGRDVDRFGCYTIRSGVVERLDLLGAKS